MGLGQTEAFVMMRVMLSAVKDLVGYAQRVPGVLSVAYAARELIHPAGGFASGVYLVAQGLVGLYAPNHGQRVVFHVLKPGDFLGLEAWLPDARPQYVATARALTDVDLLFFPPPVWNRAMEDTEFRALVFAALGQIWKGLITKDIHHRDAQGGVVWAFQHWGERTPHGVRLPLNLSLLAQILGLSRTTLKQALRRLGVVQDGDALMLPKAWAQDFLGATGSPQ